MTIRAAAVVDGVEFQVDFDTPHCIAIGLRFDGEQPNAFGLPPATAHPFAAGGFVGDTRAGGSVNCSVVTMAPHGNGTHTECVGHVVDERIDVHSVVESRLLTASLTTVELVPFGECDEAYVVPVGAGELVVTAAALSRALAKLPIAPNTDAIVIRTNAPGNQRSMNWSATMAPFPTTAAMELLAAGPWQHLLIDLPSVDRADDNGLLANHRRWWGVAPGSKSAASPPSRRTITEMVAISAEVEDGAYALSLQVAPFVLDAAPSRPFLFPLFRSS